MRTSILTGVVAPTGPITVPSGVTVRDLSQALGVPAPKIIMFMMGLGKAVTITQTLADDEAQLVAAELAPERELTIKHAADDDEEPEAFEDDDADLSPRPPVVFNAVFGIQRSTGKIVWKLGGKPVSKDGAQILTIQNDPHPGGHRLDQVGPHRHRRLDQ